MQDKKKEPYSECVSHSLHILLFVWCRYWVSSEKSGLHSPRMAASVWLKWNRNVIRNQCIRTCPDISTIAPHTFLSLSPCHSFSLSLCLSLSHAVTSLAHHLHQNHSSVADEGWNRPKCRVVSAEPRLPASYARATMEIKSAER